MAAGQATETTAPRPLLRGWLHLACFFAAIPAGWLLVREAAPDATRVGAAVYAVTVAILFGASGAYHRQRWTPSVRRRLRRLDWAAIFLLIAGTYTPLCLSAVRGSLGTVLLTVVWTGAAVGVVWSVTPLGERRAVAVVLYLSLGWLAVVALPQLAHRLSGTDIGLIVAGGVLYTAGAILLAARWPDPSPHVFGYHEVWHVMVVAAVVCHYLAVRSVLKAAR